MEIIINNTKLKLPVKVIYNGKEFWIKEGTKKDGVYLNGQPPIMQPPVFMGTQQPVKK